MTASSQKDSPYTYARRYAATLIVLVYWLICPVGAPGDMGDPTVLAAESSVLAAEGGVRAAEPGSCGTSDDGDDSCFQPRVQPLGGSGLSMVLRRLIDISGLDFGSVGGAAFDDVTGSFWLCDASEDTNDVVELDLATGAVLSSFDASVVPGLDLGPDALALNQLTGNLFLFSTFIESVAGEVTQSGDFVRSLGDANDAGGATFSPAGELLILDEHNGTIYQINQTTGEIELTIPLIGFFGRVGAADFDPMTGMLYAYATETVELLEIDAASGQVISATDMDPFLVGPSFPTGFGFNSSGTALYISSGSGVGSHSIAVLELVDRTSLFRDGFESGDTSMWSSEAP